MRKSLSLLAVVAPLALVGCGRDDTYVVTPPASSPSPGAVVVPQSAPPSNTVVVPQSGGTTKICPQGQTTC